MKIVINYYFINSNQCQKNENFPLKQRGSLAYGHSPEYRMAGQILSIQIYKTSDPGRGQYWPWVNNLNNLVRGCYTPNI